VSLLLITVRRLLWIVVIAAVGGAAYSWWRDHDAIEPSGPAEWPPLPPRPAGRPQQTAANASVVNALVDAPEARSHDGVVGGWVASADGTCPITHPVKANDNSGIFHVPDGRFYERTNAARCYQSAEAAEADGYRRAKS
jgi:hypothetical protein